MEEIMKPVYKFFTLPLFAFLLLSSSLFSQENLDDKIDKIEGKVDKVVITSEGQEYIFEGEEAAKLFKSMKRGTSGNFSWTMVDEDDGEKRVIFIDKNGNEEVIEIESEGNDKIIIKSDKDFDSETEGLRKKVKVEIEDGEKKVTVTTNENGEEKTEVYEGEEADEYIEKMKSENDDFDIMIKDDNGNDDKKVKKIIIKTEKEEDID
jgi:hypothetical protein